MDPDLSSAGLHTQSWSWEVVSSDEEEDFVLVGDEDPESDDCVTATNGNRSLGTPHSVNTSGSPESSKTRLAWETLEETFISLTSWLSGNAPATESKPNSSWSASKSKKDSFSSEANPVGMSFGDGAKVNMKDCVVTVSAETQGSRIPAQRMCDATSQHPDSQSMAIGSPLKERMKNPWLTEDAIFDCTITFKQGGVKVRKVTQKKLNEGCRLHFSPLTSLPCRPKTFQGNFGQIIHVNYAYVQSRRLRAIALPNSVANDYRILRTLDIVFWIDTESLQFYALPLSSPDVYFSDSRQEGKWRKCPNNWPPTPILSIAKYFEWFDQCSNGVACYTPMKGVTINIGDPEMHGVKFKLTPTILKLMKNKLRKSYEKA